MIIEIKTSDGTVVKVEGDVTVSFGGLNKPNPPALPGTQSQPTTLPPLPGTQPSAQPELPAGTIPGGGIVKDFDLSTASGCADWYISRYALKGEDAHNVKVACFMLFNTLSKDFWSGLTQEARMNTIDGFVKQFTKKA